MKVSQRDNFIYINQQELILFRFPTSYSQTRIPSRESANEFGD